MEFDEIRVRYRQQRRKVLREIILQKITGNKLKKFVYSEAQKVVPQMHQAAFIEDIREDLEHMDESRIVVLDVTAEQLNEWSRYAERG